MRNQSSDKLVIFLILGRLDSPLEPPHSIRDSRYSILSKSSTENRVDTWDSKEAVNLHLSGTVTEFFWERYPGIINNVFTTLTEIYKLTFLFVSFELLIFSACLAQDTHWTPAQRSARHWCQVFSDIRGTQWDTQTHTSLRGTGTWCRGHCNRCVCWALLCRHGDYRRRRRNKTASHSETWRWHSPICVGIAEYLTDGACG